MVTVTRAAVGYSDGGGGDMIAAADHLRDYGEQLCRWHERTKGNA